MRWLQYLAFALAFIGAQACSAADLPAPPLSHASGPARAGQASTDGSGDTSSTGIEGSDPGQDDTGQDDTTALDSQPGTPLDPPECTVTYTKNILPKIRDQWRCGAGGCHSAPLATGAMTVFDTGNADTTYAKLTTTLHAGKKLVDTSSALPSDSAIFCLMQGTCGERMPRQGVDPLDLALVETWLKCRSPRGTTD
ncbi:MAG: hypothetical protein JWO86_4057 [Myxococcaceae bacterium]|jgi:hypothetical protein|nr:hypothetical protein [Myxococcaceae bacterium]MEA2749787.1 hypothetical protein [Myxococcales bacterium]